MRQPIASAIFLGLCLVAGGARADAPPDGAAAALTRGDYQGAVDAANAGLAKDANNAWLHYDKGAALAALGQVEAGVAELKVARRLFTTVHEQGLAIYRIAVAEQADQRCYDAQRDYWVFARLVRATEPTAAAMAERASETCGVRPSSDRQLVSGHDDK